MSEIDWIYDLGASGVILEKNSKSPRSRNWETTQLEKAEVEGAIALGYNVGIKLGNGVVDIDIDSDTAAMVGHHLLPKTKYIFGRKSRPNSHYIYRHSGSDFYLRFEYEKKSIEIRASKKLQTMCPPSTHPSGEELEWNKAARSLPSGLMDTWNIIGAAKRLMAVSILIDNWTEGNRHFAVMALVGMLCRIGRFGEMEDDKEAIWFNDDNNLRLFIRVLLDGSSDEEADDRMRAMEGTIKKHRADPDIKLSGGKSLALILGEEVVQKVYTLLSNTPKYQKLEEWNNKYFEVVIGGKVAIGRNYNTPDGKSIKTDFMTISTFKQITSHETFETITAKGKPVSVPFHQVWLKSPHRRMYPYGIAFSPGKEAVNGYFNMWHGWDIHPKEGDCSLWMKHLKENVCKNNEEYFNWVMSFFADIFQNPTNRKGVCLVLKGGEGVGKNTIIDMVGSLLGQYYVAVSHSRHVVGNFNSHLENCLLIGAHEALYAGDKSNAGVLKSLITDPYLSIERKGYDLYKTQNCVRLAITSNEEWVVPISLENRRFMVIDMGDEKPPKQFFLDLYKQMDEDGQSALMYELMNYKIDEKTLLTLPDTEGIRDHKQIGLSSVKTWWKGRLEEGCPVGNLGDWCLEMEPASETDWPDSVVKESLYDDYYRTARDQRTALKNKFLFWEEMKVLIGNKQPLKTKRIYRQKPITNDIFIKRRMVMIVLPKHEECLRMFEEETGIKVEYVPIEKTNDLTPYDDEEF